MLAVEFRSLFIDAWREQNRLLADPLVGQYLCKEATPILVFGDWMRAEIATVGINPSDREFLNKTRTQPIPLRERRFLHRSPHDPDIATEEMADYANDLMSQYFTRGFMFSDWFKGFDPFLRGARRSFEDGFAAHTDYMSPFATRLDKNAKRLPSAAKERLLQHGLECWVKVLQLMPGLRVVLGMGAGREAVFNRLGVEGAVPIHDFDYKGRLLHCQPPHLQVGATSLLERPLTIFWWKPHKGDPLGGLTYAEKQALGELVRQHLD